MTRALCYNICTYGLNKSFKVYLSKLGVNSQEARDSIKSKLRPLTKAQNMSQETNMVTIKYLLFFSQESSHAIQDLWLYTDPT